MSSDSAHEFALRYALTLLARAGASEIIADDHRLQAPDGTHHAWHTTLHAQLDPQRFARYAALAPLPPSNCATRVDYPRDGSPRAICTIETPCVPAHATGALARAALHLDIPVRLGERSYLRDPPLLNHDPLRHAYQIVAHCAYRIGIYALAPHQPPPFDNLFHHADQDHIALPVLTDTENTTWHACVQVPPQRNDTTPTHPAFDLALQGQIATDVLRALHRIIPTLPGHYLRFPDYLRARHANDDPVTPPPALVPWSPSGACEPPPAPTPLCDDALIVDCTLPSATAATLHHALVHAGEPWRLFQAHPHLRDYPWYRDAARLTRVELLHDPADPPAPAPRHALTAARCANLRLALHITHGANTRTAYLPTDIAVLGDADQVPPRPAILLRHEAYPDLHTLAHLIDASDYATRTQTAEAGALALTSAAYERAYAHAAHALLSPVHATHTIVAFNAMRHLVPELHDLPDSRPLLLELTAHSARLVDPAPSPPVLQRHKP